ncbi:aldehyde dehydrogenase [Caballeronia jiangsuensis]|nr:aldehyde dehydrogenase [Caballeronia jiangsuensis]
MQFDSDYTMTIDGRGFETEATIDVINPANGAVIATAPRASKAQLDEAVAGATRAFPSWSAAGVEARRDAVRRLGSKLVENADALARLLTSEQGKPLADARAEILGAAYWCETLATVDMPVVVVEDSADRKVETRRVPLGVAAAIVPWNYPISIAFLKIPAALLTGNCVVVKPSPYTPLTTLKIGELSRDLFPAGVLSVLSGGDELGPWITEHPGFAKISFTGSSATGRRVVQSASHTLKRVTLELGGNDAAIVLADVNVHAVAEKIFWSAFTNAGQVCMATKRLYVHESVYDELAFALAEYAKTVKVGDGFEPETKIGPIQNRAQYDRVCRLIQDIAERGERVLIGGNVVPGAGYFVPVTIVDNPADDSPVVQEEAFGPVLPMLKFSDLDDVIARVNASPYGLAGSVWSSDPDAAALIASRIHSGTVWINDWLYITPFTPFGGRKQSGYGVECGLEGLLEYTGTQTVAINRS